jgi:hypothetical protein
VLYSARGEPMDMSETQPASGDVARAATLARLQCMVGEWTGEPRLHDGEPVSLVARTVARENAVYAIRTVAVGDGQKYEAHTVWCVEPATNAIRGFEIDSAGRVRDYVGRFEKNGTLVVEWHGLDGQQEIAQHSEFEWVGRDEMTYSMTTFGKGEAITVRYRFHRC